MMAAFCSPELRHSEHEAAEDKTNEIAIMLVYAQAVHGEKPYMISGAAS